MAQKLRDRRIWTAIPNLALSEAAEGADSSTPPTAQEIELIRLGREDSPYRSPRRPSRRGVQGRGQRHRGELSDLRESGGGIVFATGDKWCYTKTVSQGFAALLTICGETKSIHWVLQPSDAFCEALCSATPF